MKVKLIRDMGCVPCEEFPDGVKPEGTIIDHPQSYKLVKLGCAVPEDPEALAASNMSADKFADAVERMNKTISGGDVPVEDDDD